MIILFTLWYVLGWQFPTWLWILSGLFYLKALKVKKGKRKPSSTLVLPFYLALAIIFGRVDALPVLPEQMSFWTILGILFGSFMIRIMLLRPDKEYKKQVSKLRNNKSDNASDEEVELDFDGNKSSPKLYIQIKNKKKNKNSNFKISLKNGFIKEKFIQFVLKKVKKGWVDNNPEFRDQDGNLLFDIEEIYKRAKNSPIRGELFSIDNDKVTITISVK